MVLVDTSVWIDHLRRADATLSDLLAQSQIIVHPFVIGEVALGSIRNRKLVVAELANLPEAAVVRDFEVLAFIETCKLAGTGIGYVDANLLASARLETSRLWTRDKRLAEAARTLDLAFEPS